MSPSPEGLSRSSATSITISTLSTQTLVSKYHSLIKEPGILGETVDSRAGQGKSKLSLEHLVVTESKEILKRLKPGGMSKKHRSQLN